MLREAKECNIGASTMSRHRDSREKGIIYVVSPRARTEHYPLLGRKAVQDCLTPLARVYAHHDRVLGFLLKSNLCLCCVKTDRGATFVRHRESALQKTNFDTNYTP